MTKDEYRDQAAVAIMAAIVGPNHRGWSEEDRRRGADKAEAKWKAESAMAFAEALANAVWSRYKCQ